MIHLAISDSHLLCAQWSVKDGRSILTSFSYKPLPRPLNVHGNSKSEIISVLNAGLHLVREDISFEGDKVYVTIPDHYCDSVLVPIDSELTENDGWAFAKWTIDQRWSSEDSCQYYGRSFLGDSQSIFAIRVPNLFIEPIKLAIQELGGDAVWMGTESSTFFGLYPELGCTVFLPSSNGYRYYQYSQSSFQNGSARYIKNQWKLHPVVGSNSDKKAFIGNLLYAGKFSEKRKTNFKGRRIKQLTAFAGMAVEGEILPKNVKEDDLYVLTAIATGQTEGVAINFFSRSGLQKYHYEKLEALPPKPKKVKKKKPKPKKKKIRKDRELLKPTLYIFFFMVIGLMLTFDQKPELFDFIHKFKLTELSGIVDKPTLEKEPVNQDKVAVPQEIVPPYLIESQNLISIASQTLALLKMHRITSLSIGSGQMDIELIGDKIMDAPIDSLGDVVNYSLKQMSIDSLFKHGYLVKYRQKDLPVIHNTIDFSDLESWVPSFGSSFIKILDPIERENQSQTPIIIKINGKDNIRNILLKLTSWGRNLALEKFVFVSETENLSHSAIFYMSLFSPKHLELQE